MKISRFSLFILEVQAGFEPADNGVADRGLTTWLLHQTFKYLNIISKIFPFVKGEREEFNRKCEKFLLLLFVLSYNMAFDVSYALKWVANACPRLAL